VIPANIAWVRDHQRRPALQLEIAGHPAHFSSKQKVELTRRGLLQGIDYLASEWREQARHAFIQGPLEPGLSEADLRGCTNDPQVFALHQEMCQAIAAGTWQPGPRSLSPQQQALRHEGQAEDGS
jgi:hypothetical protein